MSDYGQHLAASAQEPAPASEPPQPPPQARSPLPWQKPLTEDQQAAINPPWDGVTITAKKIGYLINVTEEQLRQAEEDRQAAAEAQARWEAATPEQRAEWTRENEERRAREKAERTCEHCGCDPDEHGGY